MRFDLVTIFPEFFRGPLDHGIVKRARDAALVDVRVQDLREFTHDRHRTVDDRPFGGGEGMVLKPEPLFAAVEALLGAAQVTGHPSPLSGTAVVLLSASGKPFRQAEARRLAQLERVVLLCGRYEGVDERVAEHLATDEWSVGDFVLSGGELPAALVLDAVTRLLPGALGHQDSSVNESFSEEAPQAAGCKTERPAAAPIACHQSPLANHGILDCPHYTRPPEFRGWAVPEVLLGGNHAEIRRWRRKMALAKTARNRPELLASAALSEEDLRLLREVGVSR
jgi:tRNA (guanine37-N1)-methyltransferase